MAKQCIPSKLITVRPNDKPWMNSEIRKEIKLRNKLHKKYSNLKSMINLENFKRQRNKVNNRKNMQDFHSMKILMVLLINITRMIRNHIGS